MTTQRPFSLKSTLLAVAATAAFLLPVAAQAAEGYATTNVNMRSGPSTRYPAVTSIRAGTPVQIHGCLADTPWCDVSFYKGRGWVAGRYIQAEYQRRRIYVEPDYYDNLGIPLITFEIGNYWDRNYRNRDFYPDRNSYRRDRDRDRYDPDRRPRRDYNTFDRPRRSDDDGLTLDRPRRDPDQERIDRRRDDNDRQFREEQNNRLDRDRERIERRNRDAEQQQRQQRDADQQQRRNDQQRDFGGQDDANNNGGRDGSNNNGHRDDMPGRCRIGDVNCN
ncbi:SH3 domain-containing protein [Pararhizobium sp. PWRC1-1]|uniref:SH3 domain-containing protein n=1 Tax=Pararhizobium sp. PWRC1-1 TaxID=2804566 RepID=UPI003CED11C1